MLPRILPAIVFAATTLSSEAAVKLQGYYRLGDDDPGAVSGALFNTTTTDSAGVRDLTRNGSVLYSSDVPFPVVAGAPNAFSAEFSGTEFEDLGYSSRLLNHEDNFGIELFTKVFSTANGVAGLTYDGKKNTTGFGILQGPSGFFAQLSGPSKQVTFFGETPFALNEWYHLALVRDQGVSTFYVNGTAVGSSTAMAGTDSLTFHIGSSVGNDTLHGLIDEVRLFTFQPGTFTTRDLLISQVPEPGTAGLLAVGLTTLLTRKRRRIQPRNPMQFPQGSRT